MTFDVVSLFAQLGRTPTNVALLMKPGTRLEPELMQHLQHINTEIYYGPDLVKLAADIQVLTGSASNKRRRTDFVERD